ncbi:hypothetical protein DM01DRAFT_1385900 [Hesseltinella vesiculosa]|uniref:THIF-type NAD/FAD binding fold domain-containing protein n=1 Tax=Hesseltinella vesiculosa TaxID=101127 RepID=A0A1X2G8C4_9FUNG|nr:hypothetical protein DM01DRAFT_1385900 [Hesseltinella vesiculosa]
MSRDYDRYVNKWTLTAFAASTATASAILGYQHWQQRKINNKIKHQSRRSSWSATDPSSTRSLPLELRPILTGERVILGDAAMEKLEKSFVVVVGVGGVGSWTALMLLRAGVKRLRLIDFDQVTLSSLNRHAVATLDDVGTPKVRAMQKHLKLIAPDCDIDARIELFSAATADDLLRGQPDYIVDAIDNIQTKVDLIHYCYDHQLKVISSMGAGAKSDPSRIQITDISETLEDPLARTVRRHLRKFNIDRGIPVVYSTEKPHHVKLLPLEESRVDEADDYAALPDFRSRILPVLGTLPSLFGSSIASHVLLDLTQYPGYDPLPIKLRDGLYNRLHRDLLARESKIFKSKFCPLDLRDVAYIFEEIWHGESVLSGPQKQAVLVRWHPGKPLSLMNTVVLSKAEAKQHDRLSVDVDLVKQYGKDICDKVELRLQEQQQLRRLWEGVY